MKIKEIVDQIEQSKKRGNKLNLTIFSQKYLNRCHFQRKQRAKSKSTNKFFI